MKPRYYQTEAVNALWDYLSNRTGTPLIAMPTGCGKSGILAWFMELLLKQYPNIRFIVLTHVKELLEQNYETLKEIWPTAPAGIYSSGLNKKDIRFPIVFGGVASVVNNVEAFGHRDIWLIDECHLLSPNEDTMYQKIIAQLTEINPALRGGGLTATPYRLGQGMLTDGGLFTDICYNMTNLQGFNELLNEGYLCPIITPGNLKTKFDLSGVGIASDGDYKKNQLQAAVDKKDITTSALKEVMLYGQDRASWLIFSSGIEHSEHTASILRDMGIDAVAVHSKMTHDRAGVLRDWKSGKLRCITNNNVMTTGINHPGLDLLIDMAPTISPGKHVQKHGRMTRPVYAPGYNLETRDGRLSAIRNSVKPNGLAMDFARNTQTLGPINDPVIPRKKGQRSGTAPIKVCPQCHVLVHASVRVCDCGYEFPKFTKITRTASEADIIRSSNNLPESIWVHTSNAFYNVHKPKKGGPDCVKVTYWSGLRRFDEYVFPGRGGKRFEDWWTQRSEAPVPRSATEFMQLVEYVAKPYEIEVKVGGKYDIVNDYKF